MMFRQNNSVDKLAFWAFYIYLATFVVEGPLRYGLSLVGLSSLIYLRDLAAVSVVALAAFFSPKLCEKRVFIFFWVAAVLLLLHSIWAYFNLKNIAQVLFGLKMWIPFFLGVVCYRSLCKHLPEKWKYFAFLLLISSIGVIANYFTEMPWAGAEYEVAGIAIRGVKEWYAGGFKRLYGLGRASGTVAVQLLLLWAIVIFFVRSNLIRLIFTVLAIVAIILTTTKGVWLAFMVIFVYLAIDRIAPKFIEVKAAYVLLLGAFVVVLPLFFVVVDFKRVELPGMWHLAFSSFVERGVNMWPRAIDLLEHGGGLIAGRGVGGAGTPQIYFEPMKNNPADNFFIYWWLWFGFAGFFYYLWALLSTATLDYRRDAPEMERFFVLLAIAFFVYGFTTAVMEGGEFACFGGVLFARFAAQRLQRS